MPAITSPSSSKKRNIFHSKHLGTSFVRLHFGIFVTRTNFAFKIDQKSLCIALTFLSRSQRSFVTKTSTEPRDILIGDLKIVHLCLDHYISPKILSNEATKRGRPVNKTKKIGLHFTAGVARKKPIPVKTT